VPGVRSFDLAGGENLSFREMTARVLACLPGPPRAVVLPDPAFRLLNGAARWLRPEAALNPAQVRRMAHDLVTDDAAARRGLGWNPRPFLPEVAMFDRPARLGL
jgi:nucleoside-diphosphate-sugar epimerase